MSSKITIKSVLGRGEDYTNPFKLLESLVCQVKWTLSLMD